MSQSTDPGHFFQSASALDNAARKAEKAKNDHGSPIKTSSKILAIISDTAVPSAVFIAAASGTVGRYDLEARCLTHTFTPSQSQLAPLTCLAIATPRSGNTAVATLYAGSWDKNVYSWQLEYSSEGQLKQNEGKYSKCIRLTGHTDFVKALCCLKVGAKPYLASGSADASIIIWDTETNTRLHTLKGHSRGVQALAVDPLSYVLSEGNEYARAILYSGDSNREIRAWAISDSSAKEIQLPLFTNQQRDKSVSKQNSTVKSQNSDIEPLIVHETSIYALSFAAESGDLWTASADKTVKCLGRPGLHADEESISETAKRYRDGKWEWTNDTTLDHPDFVRAVVIDEEAGLVITACRDEEIRMWDAADEELIHTYAGHYEEVTGLAFIYLNHSVLSSSSSSDTMSTSTGRKTKAVASVSIDGTIRTWSLDREVIKQAREKQLSEQRGIASQGVSGSRAERKGPVLTEEEERELAELMDSDEDG